MSDFQVLAEGLAFPEGPLVMPDGSLVVTEIARGCLTRIDRAGKATRLADTGGGPNGAALSPDGLLYVCNNGGFSWDRNAGLKPVGRADDNIGGRIQRVNPGTIWFSMPTAASISPIMATGTGGGWNSARSSTPRQTAVTSPRWPFR
jgi:sugar lactone lactonase YvrE